MSLNSGKKDHLLLGKGTVLSTSWTSVFNPHFIFPMFCEDLVNIPISLPLRRHTLLHHSVLRAFLPFPFGSIRTRWAQVSAQLSVYHCLDFPHNAERFGRVWGLGLATELKVHGGWEAAIVASLVLHLNRTALTWQTLTDFNFKKYIYTFFSLPCTNSVFVIITIFTFERRTLANIWQWTYYASKLSETLFDLPLPH